MATNNEVATSLRALAEAAERDVAEHDLNNLADSLEGLDQGPLTEEQLREAVAERIDPDAVTDAKYHHDGLYIKDRFRGQFIEEFPNWKLVNKNGENNETTWWNFPVRRDE